MWLYFIHPILTITFHIERSKHPQNILRIFSLRCHISTMTTLVLLTSALFARKSAVTPFKAKNIHFFQPMTWRLCWIFIEIYKPYTICPESGFWVAANWTKIRKMKMTPQLACRMSLSNFCWRCRVSLNNFIYKSKFHVNLTIISQVMTIFIYKGFERNSRNCEKALSEICPISGDWDE